MNVNSEENFITFEKQYVHSFGVSAVHLLCPPNCKSKEQLNIDITTLESDDNNIVDTSITDMALSQGFTEQSFDRITKISFTNYVASMCELNDSSNTKCDNNLNNLIHDLKIDIPNAKDIDYYVGDYFKIVCDKMNEPDGNENHE